MSDQIVNVEQPLTRKVQVLLTVEYAGNTEEDLAQTMRHAMEASINVGKLLEGCDNIDAKVVDYSMAIHELTEEPALIQENPQASGNDWILNTDKGHASCWVGVDDRVVYIRRTNDDHLCIDVMRGGDEDGEPIESMSVPPLLDI